MHRFIGRLTRDPELRTFDGGKCVCNVRILINRPGSKRDDGQEPDGFKLELWNELALSFVDAHRKGSLCDVWGRVRSEGWTDRTTGEQRTGLVIVVHSWQPVDQPTPASKPAAAPATTWESKTSIDDEVPF